jgi:hypothetical protein
MRLFFRETPLGDITEVGSDQPWWVGQFAPYAEADAFRAFFEWMVDEEKSSLPGDPPFDEALWTDENWFIEDDSGQKRGICVPAVHNDGQIWWRPK